MTFPTAGWMLSQDFLAGKGRVSSSSASCVTTNVAIGMPDIVPVFLIEGVIRNKLEGLTPENKTVLQCQPNTFEEQGVLQSPEMLEMAVLA